MRLSDPMKIRGTDFIMLEVSNLAEAARFYREVLELPQEIYSDEYQWAEFNCGNVTLAIKGGVDLAAAKARARIALSVEDIHAAFGELKSRGARGVGEPQDNSCCWHLEMLDPDGNIVILHHRADGTFGQNLPNAAQATSKTPPRSDRPDAPASSV